MDAFLVIALSAATSISTLLIASIGLAVIFGLMRIINMAHGEFLMIGAFATIYLVRSFGFPVLVAALGGAAASALLGLVVEIVLIRPLYGRRLVDTLLVTFGLSLVLFQLAVDIFGTTSPGISTPFGAIQIGQYSVSTYSLLLIPIAGVLVGVVFFVFTRTKYGLLARAAAQNPEMASALGVDAKKINVLTFMLGSALAGLGGGLLAPIVAVSPGMGQAYIGQAFMTVITGGQAFLVGTLASAIALGGIQNIVAQLVTTFWGLAALFLTSIVILRFMPEGLSAHWKRQL
ncbi:branched-chain amino acid ABC transporter permease [Mesorhizobium kowhaii]|uniref:branched-chain amino acid ABC transporter permease n=1 Tax=Mesorhizobium kowhaii TaxID=1300272 RepID=UPI0035E832F8